MPKLNNGKIKVGISIVGLIVLFGGGWLAHERGIAKNSESIQVESAKREGMKEQLNRMEEKLDRLIEQERGGKAQ